MGMLCRYILSLNHNHIDLSTYMLPGVPPYVCVVDTEWLDIFTSALVGCITHNRLMPRLFGLRVSAMNLFF